MNNRWTPSGTYPGPLCLVLGFLFLGSMSMAYGCTVDASAEQPIAYNHKKHVKDNNIECDTCHRWVQERKSAGRPSVEVCAECHDEAQGKTTEEAKVVKLVQSKKDIPWERVTKLPASVYFSHARHVKAGKIGCETCHGPMAQQTSPPTKPLAKITMSACIGCHESRRVTTDCNACHK